MVEHRDSFLRAGLFLCCAVPITCVDLKSRRIPDGYSLGGLVCLALYGAVFAPSSLPADLAAAFLAFALLFCVRAVRGGLGFGDLKYAALTAFYVGLPFSFVALGGAAMAAALFFAFASLADRHRLASARIPFAPFLTIGALAAAAAAKTFVAGGGP
jgi:prepilin signal peptidase PulO-like enzyme (type II secretory pathway)